MLNIPYAIGDLQGCALSLDALLGCPELADVPLRFVGDLVNRGPDSLGTLRRMRSLGNRAKCVLGNHDIHLLAVAAGVRKLGRRDTIQDILGAPDREELLDWLRHIPLAREENGFLLVHAGVLPQWSVEQTLDLASEVEKLLRGPNWRTRIRDIFGNEPVRWKDSLKGDDRLRVIVNALTRLRFCTEMGDMEFSFSGPPADAPVNYLPWFDVPGRQATDATVVCGHWSALGLMLRPDVIALDTGCVWAGQLSAVSLDVPKNRKLVQVNCKEEGLPIEAKE
nr:symmetrical bis(5'-nucleosyl)-tetraphosphatase [Cupriavidus sp. D384]